MISDTKYNICVQDKNGVWTPVAGEYETQQEVLSDAYAIRSAFAIFVGKFSPPIMVQRWERAGGVGTWRTVQWHLIETGIWTNKRP